MFTYYPRAPIGNPWQAPEPHPGRVTLTINDNPRTLPHHYWLLVPTSHGLAFTRRATCGQPHCYCDYIAVPYPTSRAQLTELDQLELTAAPRTHDPHTWRTG